MLEPCGPVAWDVETGIQAWPSLSPHDLASAQGSWRAAGGRLSDHLSLRCRRIWNWSTELSLSLSLQQASSLLSCVKSFRIWGKGPCSKGKPEQSWGSCSLSLSFSAGFENWNSGRKGKESPEPQEGCSWPKEVGAIPNQVPGPGWLLTLCWMSDPGEAACAKRYTAQFLGGTANSPVCGLHPLPACSSCSHLYHRDHLKLTLVPSPRR